MTQSLLLTFLRLWKIPEARPSAEDRGLIMDQIYRVVYCSRSRVPLPLAQQATEIRIILAKSSANNQANNITWALLFTGAAFAHVLEGPLEAVEATSEKIQRDLRHDEVAVSEAGYLEAREFPGWSMVSPAQIRIKLLHSRSSTSSSPRRIPPPTLPRFVSCFAPLFSGTMSRPRQCALCTSLQQLPLQDLWIS